MKFRVFQFYIFTVLQILPNLVQCEMLDGSRTLRVKKNSTGSVTLSHSSIYKFSPSFVFIGDFNEDGSFNIRCTGSIISKDKILTAAECKPHKLANARVVAGVVDLKDLSRSQIELGAAQIREISEWYNQPDYNDRKRERHASMIYYNVAVAKLTSKFTFDKKIHATKLPGTSQVEALVNMYRECAFVSLPDMALTNQMGDGHKALKLRMIAVPQFDIKDDKVSGDPSRIKKILGKKPSKVAKIGSDVHVKVASILRKQVNLLPPNVQAKLKADLPLVGDAKRKTKRDTKYENTLTKAAEEAKTDTTIDKTQRDSEINNQKEIAKDSTPDVSDEEYDEKEDKKDTETYDEKDFEKYDEKATEEDMMETTKYDQKTTEAPQIVTTEETEKDDHKNDKQQVDKEPETFSNAKSDANRERISEDKYAATHDVPPAPKLKTHVQKSESFDATSKEIFDSRFDTKYDTKSDKYDESYDLPPREKFDPKYSSKYDVSDNEKFTDDFVPPDYYDMKYDEVDPKGYQKSDRTYSIGDPNLSTFDAGGGGGEKYEETEEADDLEYSAPTSRTYSRKGSDLSTRKDPKKYGRKNNDPYGLLDPTKYGSKPLGNYERKVTSIYDSDEIPYSEKSHSPKSSSHNRKINDGYGKSYSPKRISSRRKSSSSRKSSSHSRKSKLRSRPKHHGRTSVDVDDESEGIDGDDYTEGDMPMGRSVGDPDETVEEDFKETRRHHKKAPMRRPDVHKSYDDYDDAEERDDRGMSTKLRKQRFQDYERTSGADIDDYGDMGVPARQSPADTILSPTLLSLQKFKNMSKWAASTVRSTENSYSSDKVWQSCNSSIGAPVFCKDPNGVLRQYGMMVTISRDEGLYCDPTFNYFMRTDVHMEWITAMMPPAFEPLANATVELQADDNQTMEALMVTDSNVDVKTRSAAATTYRPASGLLIFQWLIIALISIMGLSLCAQ